MISEQGPGGEGVSQEAKQGRGIPGCRTSKCKDPKVGMSLQLEWSEQEMKPRGSGSFGTVATVRTLALPLSRWEPRRVLGRQQSMAWPGF